MQYCAILLFCMQLMKAYVTKTSCNQLIDWFCYVSAHDQSAFIAAYYVPYIPITHAGMSCMSLFIPYGSSTSRTSCKWSMSATLLSWAPNSLEQTFMDACLQVCTINEPMETLSDTSCRQCNWMTVHTTEPVHIQATTNGPFDMIRLLQSIITWGSRSASELSSCTVWMQYNQNYIYYPILVEISGYDTCICESFLMQSFVWACYVNTQCSVEVQGTSLCSHFWVIYLTSFCVQRLWQ